MTDEKNAVDTNESEKERQALLSRVELLNSKIQQKIQLLLAHPETPQEFRDHPSVKKMAE